VFHFTKKINVLQGGVISKDLKKLSMSLWCLQSMVFPNI
jgi:hypothetical protein